MHGGFLCFIIIVLSSLSSNVLKTPEWQKQQKEKPVAQQLILDPPVGQRGLGRGKHLPAQQKQKLGETSLLEPVPKCMQRHFKKIKASHLTKH